MENTKPKEILENIINVMEKTRVDDWEIDKLVVVLNYINELEKENKILKELNVCVGCNINTDYKSRIDKAIEYIEQWRDSKTKIIDSRLKGTLEILRGEANE